MLQLIIFILANAGATYIVTSSNKFMRFRDWVKKKSDSWGTFVKCSLCVGAWAAIPIYCIQHFATLSTYTVSLEIFPYMMIGSITAYFICLIITILKVYANTLTNKFLRS